MDTARSFRSIALLSALGLALVGCGGPAQPTAPAVTPPSTTAAATPSPTADPYTMFITALDGAGLTTQELGGGTVKSHETTSSLDLACNRAPGALAVGARYWGFTNAKPDTTSLTVSAFYPEAGSAVVDQAHNAVSACKTWNWGGRWTMAIVGDVTVTKPTGADGTTAYCQKGTIIEGKDKGLVNYHCDAFVSRGHLVAQIRTLQLTLAKAQSELKKIVPLGAAALVRAAPTP